ncbi:hypothetical protein MPER_06818, partial [Moniliophthora perniciosa FA553]
QLLRPKSGGPVWRKIRIERMGSVAIDLEKDRLVVSTGNDYQIFSISKFKHHQTLESSSPPVVFYPKQVVFAEGGSKVVGGTDSGHVAVYDIEGAKLVQKLPYSRGGLVQSVATYGDNSQVFVALAGSTAEKPADVIIWRKKVKPKSKPLVDRIPFSKPSRGLTITLTIILVVLLGGVYLLTIYQLNLSISWSIRDPSHQIRYPDTTPIPEPPHPQGIVDECIDTGYASLLFPQDPAVEDISTTLLPLKESQVYTAPPSKMPPVYTATPLKKSPVHAAPPVKEMVASKEALAVAGKHDPRLIGVGSCDFDVYSTD